MWWIRPVRSRRTDRGAMLETGGIDADLAGSGPVVVRTLAFLVLRRVLGVVGGGPSPDGKARMSRSPGPTVLVLPGTRSGPHASGAS